MTFVLENYWRIDEVIWKQVFQISQRDSWRIHHCHAWRHMYVLYSMHVRVSGCTVTFFYISELRNVFLIYTVFSMPWKCLAKTWLRVQRYAPGTVCCLFPCIVGYRSHQKHQTGVFLKFLVIRSLETCKVPSFLFNSEMTENVTREH